MAFYARSEEARQSHATQNFALVMFLFTCFFMLFLSIFRSKGLVTKYGFILFY